MDSARAPLTGNEGLPTFLVEHYWPDATADDFRAVVARVRAVVDEMAGSGAALRFLHSTFVPEEESALCVFSASLPALVEQAYRRAGIGFERVLNVLEIEASSPLSAHATEE